MPRRANHDGWVHILSPLPCLPFPSLAFISLLFPCSAFYCLSFTVLPWPCIASPCIFLSEVAMSCLALPGNAWTYLSHLFPPRSVTSLSGILPGILSLLYEASRAIEGAKTREKFLATVKEKPSSYTAMAFSSFLPHSMQPLNASPSLNYRKVSRWTECSAFSNIFNFYRTL